MEQDFDQFAKDYRNTHTANIKLIAGADSYYFAKHKVTELQRFETNAIANVLDLGCGDGATSYYMAQEFPGFIINGVDISLESIKVAEERKVPNANFLWYDGNQLPYPDNSFEIVFVAGVLHHVLEEKQLLLIAEITRVLKKGGRLYLFEHNPNNPLTRHLVNTCVFDKGVKLLKASRTSQLIKRSGLEIKETRYIVFFPRNRFFKWFHKLESFLVKCPFGGQYYIRAVKSNQH